MACIAGDRCGSNAGATRCRRAGVKPCDNCRKGESRYNKRRRYRAATRGPAYTDPTPAIEHLTLLNHQGAGAGIGYWWFLEYAKTLGLSATQLRRIHAGQIRRCWPATVDKILTISIDDYDAAGELRDRRTAEGLIAALLDKGWHKRGINKALGRASNALQIGRGDKVKRHNLGLLRQLLADHERPPAQYVTPPIDGWHVEWNQRPAHKGRLHHTRRGCWRRGCCETECVNAKQAYDRHRRAVREGRA